MVDIPHVAGPQRCAAHHLVERKGNVAVAAGAEHRVHLGQLAQHIVLVALRHAAGDDDLLESSLLLELRHFEDIIDGFLAGRSQKAAGVDHGHIRPLGREDDIVPRVLHRGHHLLAVDLVFGTAEGNKEHIVGHNFSPVRRNITNDHSS